MDTLNLITELQDLGYDLYLEGENLRYKYHALIEPPKERVILLLDTLKRNKGEVTEYLTFKDKPIPFDTLWRMFKDSLKHIEKVYSPIIWNTGIMDTPEYRQVWDRLNDIQLDCIKGRVSLGEYQDTLKEWQRVVKEVSNGNDKNFFI